MSLKFRSLIWSIIGSIILSLVVGITLYFSLSVGFTEVENRILISELDAAKSGLHQRIETLHSKLGDWSNWDDTYKFVQDNNEEYRKSNFSDASMEALQIDAMVLLNVKGEVVSKLGVRKNKSGEMEIDEALVDLASMPVNEKEIAGFKAARDGRIYFFASRPILKSNGEGPQAGQIIVAKFWTDKDDSKLSMVVGNTVKLSPSADLPNNQVVTRKLETIEGVREVMDVNEKPVGQLVLLMKRDYYLIGQRTIWVGLLVAILGSMVGVMLSYWQSYNLVFKRFTGLKTVLSQVVSNNQSINKLDVGSENDEISDLKTIVNKLLDYKQSLWNREIVEKKRLAEYLDHLEEFIIVIDEGNVGYVNKPMLDLFGIKVAQMIAVDKFVSERNLTDNQGRVRMVNFQVVTLGEANKKMLVGKDVTDVRRVEAEREDRSRQMQVLNDAMVNRELKMIDLKKEIEMLKGGGGEKIG